MSKCKLEVYSRVTGFFRPVDAWNKGKKEEYKDRKKFEVENDTSTRRYTKHQG